MLSMCLEDAVTQWEAELWRQEEDKAGEMSKYDYKQWKRKQYVNCPFSHADDGMNPCDFCPYEKCVCN